jgi:LysM repeat protein
LQEKSMYKKFSLVLTILLAAVSLLSACERSAVPAQTSLNTPASQTTGTPQIVALADAYKTQTAANLEGTLAPGASAGTPTATLLGGATAVPTNTLMPTAINPNAATPTPGRPSIYKLQPGEFPYCIARRFNVDPDALLALNGLSSGQVYQPGFELKIPQTGSFPGNRMLKSHPDIYKVQVNDTIYSIACKYGDVDPFYLASYNGIAAPYVLQTGQTLNIP